jgi:hypothetical protein
VFIKLHHTPREIEKKIQTLEWTPPPCVCVCVCTFSSFGTLGFDPLGFCIMREHTSIANQSPDYYYSPARFAAAMEAQEMCD